ncbi:MAG: hypothetical protein AAB421_01730 [Patescibacteria group bacterium]
MLRRYLAFVVLGLVFVGVTFFAQSHTTPFFLPEGATVRTIRDANEAVWGTTVPAQLASITPSCPPDDDFACWEKFYRDLSDNESSVVALADIKARYATRTGLPFRSCHSLLHIIGEKAGAEFDTVADAYAHGDTVCRAGFHHGVLVEELTKNGSNPLGSAWLDSLCTSTYRGERGGYHYFNCVHSVGHGLMAYFEHDLFQALDGCGKFSGSWERTTCYGGVFMENVNSASAGVPSRFLRDDDLLYPCNEVSEEQRRACYWTQPYHMLNITNGDFSRIFGACGSVENSEARIQCFQSLGRDGAAWLGEYSGTVASSCALGLTREARTSCLLGAASELTLFYESSEEAFAVCDASTDTDFIEACKTEAATYLEKI